MTKFVGALGQCGLKKLDGQNDCRIQNASFLAKELKGSNMVKVRTPMAGEKSVFYENFLDVLDDSKSFQSKIFIDAGENGIPIQRTWNPLHFTHILIIYTNLVVCHGQEKLTREQ